MYVGDLNEANFATFNTLERVASALSLLGTAFVAITFLGSEAFQKPINRLVFYACLGNIFTNVATIMARAAIEAVHDDNYNTNLCQFQGVLIQMFLPADALWTFVMALNVYLTFYRSYNAEDLRRLEKWYALLCYGVPFIPAIVFVFVQNSKQGHMYGNATLWCWIDSEWDIWRIAAFYGPVWVVIFATICIYFYAGKDIWQKTKMLRDFKHPTSDPLRVPNNPFNGVPQEVVYVTSDTVVETTTTINLDQLSPNSRPTLPRAPVPTSKYNVTISAGSPRTADSSLENGTRFSYSEKTPGELRRVSTAAPASPYAPPARQRAVFEANSAMMSYTKVAGLFFIAMMITWIPSSANRLYSVVNPNQVSVALECLAAFVLPLQGFWNALIYATTSLPACRSLWKQLKENKRLSGSGIRNLRRGFVEATDSHVPRASHQRTPSRCHHETDSMTELKESRPQSGREGSGDGENRIDADYLRQFPSPV